MHRPRSLFPHITREGLEHLGELEAARKLDRAIGSVIAENKDVTYDLKKDRNDPTAVGTQEMAEAICKKMQAE